MCRNLIATSCNVKQAFLDIVALQFDLCTIQTICDEPLCGPHWALDWRDLCSHEPHLEVYGGSRCLFNKQQPISFGTPRRSPLQCLSFLDSSILANHAASLRPSAQSLRRLIWFQRSNFHSSFHAHQAGIHSRAWLFQAQAVQQGLGPFYDRGVCGVWR